MTGESDVLVVGAGPSGLAAALQASEHGAAVRIVDRRAAAFRPSRAMMLHARALECLRPLGVTEQLLDRADTAPQARLHLGSRIVRVGLGHVDLPDTAFPHLTLIRQADVEEVLRLALHARGLQVEWGTEFLGLELGSGTDGTVGSELRSAERGSERHRSRFIAGCDGQSSLLRGLVGAEWRGARYPVEALLADVELTGHLEPGLLHVAVGAASSVFLFALGEGATWRLLATRPAGGRSAVPFGAPGPPVPAEDLAVLLRGSGLGATLAEVRWSERVPLQHRVASRFRRGALFLVGDAAHTHSPAGGQGMNNGILDAVNLGWKLAFAAAGAGTGRLLDSYEQERRRAAQEVLALTRLVFFGEASQNPAARLVRGALLPPLAPVLPPLLRRRALTARVVRLLAQPFVRYRHSPISVDEPPEVRRWPRPGDRLPDRTVVAGGRRQRLHELTAAPGIHVLLEREAPTGAIRESVRARRFVHVHRLESDPGRALVAVRPDGYVGFRCGDARPDRLVRWLDLVAVPR